MCDSNTFRQMYFDPAKSTALQTGFFPHPCVPESELKTNKKGKDNMMTLVRQNEVGNVMLYGTPIVSLFIDEQERLCLAQISNTLLKDFSYNEIHNRRVALGITCLQCTPVQLEILRRAGAMPVSSRRCGLITKREAERLVKSFLEDIAPPQLPEDFKFEVYHECGWGCRGNFMPSRYNSSRAKCIECNFCKGYFSPNKFIFHYHRSHASAYRHPDAANFNSWRRHLKLCEQNPSDGLVHAWEDVKAMFNGGSRKRMISHSTNKSESSPKLPNHPSTSTDDIGFYSLSPTTAPFPYYPYMPMTDPMNLQRWTQGGMHPAFPRGVPCPRSPNIPSYGDVLRSLSAPYTMMWMQQPNTTKPDMNFLMRRCEVEDCEDLKSPKAVVLEDKKTCTNYKHQTSIKTRQNERTGRVEMADSSSNDSDRFSSITPFLKPFKQSGKQKSNKHSVSNCDGSEDELQIDVEKEEERADNEANQELDTQSSGFNSMDCVETCAPSSQSEPSDVPGVDSTGRISEPLTDTQRQTTSPFQDLMSEKREWSLSGFGMDLSSLSNTHYSNMPLDELHELLSRAKKAREEAEKRNKRLQGSLEDTLLREARIKQELSQQIVAMRGTLSSEIDQERKAKELIQQRLKEVHDALHDLQNGMSVDKFLKCPQREDRDDGTNTQDENQNH